MGDARLLDVTHFWTSEIPYSLYRRCISRRRYVAKTWAIYHNAQNTWLYANGLHVNLLA